MNTSMETSMHADAIGAASRRTGLTRRGPASLAAGCAALAALMFGPRAASAEESANRVRAAVTDPSETPYPAQSFGQGMQLELHGNSETDVGYAAYSRSSFRELLWMVRISTIFEVVIGR